MTDIFASFATSIDAPPLRAVAITTHDTNELTNGACRGIYVGTAGTLIARLVGDTVDTTWKNASGYMAGRFQYVRATGTLAADMLALY